MLTVIIRTTIMYIFVTVAIRLMGKRQIGDMQPNELVITLLLSEIAAIPLQDTTQPIINGLVAISILIILEIIISVTAMKSLKFRKLISGRSVVIIKNGIIDENAMKQVRMTVIDLIELLRQNDIFELGEVAYAVLEVNGNLSVLKKSFAESPTRGDLGLALPQDGLALPVICDGKVIRESLDALEISDTDFFDMMRREERDISQIFLMMLDRNGKTEVVGKRERI